MDTESEVNQNKSTVTIYHEKQSRQLCALHALNNLFQNNQTFTKSDLDKISETLSPSSFFNPHKSLIGLGNYDINVILVALNNKTYEAIWFNKTKDPSLLNLANIFGFILNIQNSCDIWKNIATFFTASKRHWIAVKNISSVYYNLDSKLEKPQIIGNEEILNEYLRKHLRENDTEIFVVVTKEIAQNNSWLKSE